MLLFSLELLSIIYLQLLNKSEIAEIFMLAQTLPEICHDHMAPDYP